MIEENNPTKAKSKSDKSEAAKQTGKKVKEVWSYHFGNSVIWGKEKVGDVESKEKMIVADKKIKEKVLSLYER